MPNGGASCDAIELRDYLKSRLPDYMIPSDFSAPRIVPAHQQRQGRSQALPRPDARTLTDLPVAPRDTVELELTHIWKDLLGKESVGVCDDFFLVGGHSLLAVRLLARIRDAFGQDVPLAAFCQNPTIERDRRVAACERRIEVRVAAHRDQAGQNGRARRCS